MNKINEEIVLSDDQKEAFEKLLQHATSSGLEFYGETRVAGHELMNKIMEAGYVFNLAYKVPKPSNFSRNHFSTLTLKVWNHKSYEDKENTPMYHRCEVAVAIHEGTAGNRALASCGWVDVLDVFWQQLVKAEDFSKSLDLLNSQKNSHFINWKNGLEWSSRLPKKTVEFAEEF